ncbi:MAG: hypothetical protein GEV03_23665, partial [Streptosporangiales bacterium]|nr:hypothetical protein [Streptosporangiales bacterium]
SSAQRATDQSEPQPLDTRRHNSQRHVPARQPANSRTIPLHQLRNPGQNGARRPAEDPPAVLFHRLSRFLDANQGVKLSLHQPDIAGGRHVRTFTRPARQTVVGAREAASRLNYVTIGPEHLLLSLVQAGDGVGYRILVGYGLTATELEREISERTLRRAGLSERDAEALRTIGVDPDEIVRRVEESFGKGALSSAGPERRRGLRGSRGPHIPFTREAKQILEGALREALALKHNYIGTEHILLAMLSEDRGIATDVLTEHGLSYDVVRQRVLDELRRAS